MSSAADVESELDFSFRYSIQCMRKEKKDLVVKYVEYHTLLCVNIRNICPHSLVLTRALPVLLNVF